MKMKTPIAASLAALISSAAVAADFAGTIPDTVGRVSPALAAYSTEALVGTVWRETEANRIGRSDASLGDRFGSKGVGDDSES